MDYDEIRIHEADDYQIEKMVMQAVTNLTEEKRDRLKTIPVYINRDLEISTAKMNLLREYFDVKIGIPGIGGGMGTQMDVDGSI